MYEYSDTAQQVQREVNSRDWLAKNKSRVLRACKITNPEDESPEALAAAQAFVQMMENVVTRNGWGWSMNSLENAFETLIRKGLLSTAEPPPPPAPKPKLYYLELRSPGAETKTKGPFSAQDAIARARFYAKEQVAVTIRTEQGDALDMDLQPLQDDPLARTQQAPQHTQRPRAKVVQDVYDQEYQQFFNRSKTQQIKSRMRTDKGFADWVGRSGQFEYAKASSGGVDREGNPAEPVRL